VSASSGAALEAARETLERGALILYPTDTLYAVGGRVFDDRVATAVRRAKGRADDKPLPIIVANLEQVRQIAAGLPQTLMVLAERFWPGPLTLVLSAANAVPKEVTAGTGRVAVRIPALDFARRLCDQGGPLIATSANRSGEPAASTLDEALRAMGEYVALAIDGGASLESRPSTIVDLTGDTPRLLRAGAVVWETVLRALGERYPR
jgi:tRNA threonylcarbamoyl adenosine modification protein (Sua5/YciO/YrdC/YwlC family)